MPFYYGFLIFGRKKNIPSYLTHRILESCQILLHLSGLNESGANKNNEREEAFCETKEYVWCQNKNYVGGATC